MATLITHFLGFSVPIGLAGIAESKLISHLQSNVSSGFIAGLVEPLLPFSLGTFQVIRCFGLVLLVNVIDSSIAIIYFSLMVGKARKKYGVHYPNMYATGDDEKSTAFNCIQRGHQNALESHTIFLATSVIAGLRHPILAAAAGMLWIASRVSFFNDYSKGSPEKRYSSKLSYLHWYALTSLSVMSCSTALGFLKLL